MRAAGGVIERAIVDLVTLVIGFADSEMVVMGRVDNVLFGERGVAAWERRDDIGGLHPLNFVGELKRGRYAQRHGLEVAAPGGLSELVQVLTGEFEYPVHGVFGGPGRNLNPRLVAGRNLELGTRPRRLDDLEGIARRRCRMNDDRARRTQLGGLLVLVGPTPVVEPPYALEKIIRPVRIVVDDHQHLAGDVQPFEVVPVVLGRLNAVADKDQLGVVDRGGLLLDTTRGDVLVPPRQGNRLAALAKGPGFRHRGVDTDDVEGLFPGAVSSTRRITHLFEFGDQVLTRHRIALAAGTATAVFVACEFRDRGAKCFGGDLGESVGRLGHDRFGRCHLLGRRRTADEGDECDTEKNRSNFFHLVSLLTGARERTIRAEPESDRDRRRARCQGGRC